MDFSSTLWKDALSSLKSSYDTALKRGTNFLSFTFQSSRFSSQVGISPAAKSSSGTTRLSVCPIHPCFERTLQMRFQDDSTSTSTHHERKLK